jgi:signal transduction histidine kinase
MVQILTEAERTSRLIDSLLLLARADAGEDALHSELTDVSTSIREAISQGHALAVEKKIAMTADLGADPVAIHGDPEALRRLFFILIENAVKYTPEGGSVRVRLADAGGYATVSIADSGMGISKDDLQHIFDRFWRADKVRSRGMGGAGLGLSIARWIVDRHGATLDVQSEPGQGSTFVVKLPLRSPAP